ncbi:tripartite tricarboxylate transporter substrate binding protein [Bordetella sp. 02P26C-1]|nr:tripartite tricarboxylate transporter substrate binding protein [Bordetella sp. 02P26C-1]
MIRPMRGKQVPGDTMESLQQSNRGGIPSLKRRQLLQATFGLAAFAASGMASSDSHWAPTKPLRLVVPFPPGGITDTQARKIAHKLSEQLNQAVIVENRAGASGSIGTEYASRLPSDGHTLILGTQGTIFLNRIIYPEQTQGVASLLPVHGVSLNPITLVANPDRPYSTLAELIEFARLNPGKVNVASPGAGTGAFLSFMQLQSEVGIKTTPVHYKGSAAAINDLVGGVVDVMPDYMVAVDPFVREGRLRALAVGSNQRLAIAPNVPTIKQTGVVDDVLTPWTALFAPPGTSPAAVARLSREVATALRDPSIQSMLVQGGSVPMQAFGTVELANFLQKEGPIWEGVAREVGLKPAAAG